MILSLIGFWRAQFFLDCYGMFCEFPAIYWLWVIFAVLTVATYLLKPMSVKQFLIRFFGTSIMVISAYSICYDYMIGWDFTYQPDYTRFVDYSLLGIMLTIGFALCWLLPTESRSKPVVYDSY